MRQSLIKGGRTISIQTKACFLALLFAACSQGLVASPASDGVQARPKIGLVLGGGGAKGAAHIGVLRVLDEMRIPIDCVAGTSMGALVGGTFAAGIPVDEIEHRVLDINWAETVGGTGERDQMPIQRKLRSRPFTNSIELGFVDGGLKGAGGFLNTQNIDDLLRSLVAGARNVDDFDSLPIPFRAVATDMVSGDMVVLQDGDLSVAMRASMSVPGIFSPVVQGERVLADGGQMRNVPVDIARKLCGDVIIAVSLSTPEPTAADLRSSLALAGRSLEVMINANSRAQLATLTERDVSIVVPMGDIGSGSFEKVPQAIPLGQMAARSMAAQLGRYSLPEADYRAWRAGVTRQYPRSIRPADVTVVGLERVNVDYVEQAIRATKADSDVTPRDVSDDASRIFALGDFESVSYRISHKPAFPTVEFHPLEKAWGPDFVTFDLGLAFADEGNTTFILRAEHRRVWINALGGEWHNVVQIGDDLELRTGIYQPLRTDQRFFVEPFLRVDRMNEDVYDDNNRLAEYEFLEGYGQLDFGVNLGTVAQLRAGIRQSWNQVDLKTGIPDLLPDYPTTYESDLVVKAKYDTRDTVGLPIRGNLLVGRYVSAGSGLGGDESYELAELMGASILPLEEHVISVFAAGGMDINGELPSYRLFRIGGQLSFPGLQRQQLRGDSYWLGGARYHWKVADIQTLFQQALYASVRLTTGSVSGRVDGEDDELLTGISLALSGRTPIGPFILSLGAVDNGSAALQMEIGRPVREGSIIDELW